MGQLKILNYFIRLPKSKSLSNCQNLIILCLQPRKTVAITTRTQFIISPVTHLENTSIKK